VQYVLLIYDEEGERERHPGFRSIGDLQAKGTLLASEELQPVATATTVRVRNGDTVVSDGPFAETEETLGGYCLIEADSLDEAIEWASRIPSARSGTVEIRPVVDNLEHRE
jgi:hypothetical protein